LPFCRDIFSCGDWTIYRARVYGDAVSFLFDFLVAAVRGFGLIFTDDAKIVISIIAPLRNERPRIPSRDEINAELDARLRDMYDEYTPAERRAMEQAERENYNKNIRCAVWWAGGDTYVDYDGNTRNV
jgi:hypothetical protein